MPIPPWSMASQIRKEERDWVGNNRLRKRFKYGWFGSEILKGGEHPIRYCFALNIFLILVAILSFLLPEEWFSGRGALWDKKNQLDLFISLWAVQVTMAALVYPFVISFIALLLQRRPSSKAFLQIYLADSGGLISGLSSLFLVLFMSLQYVAFTTYSLDEMAIWVMVDSVWFVYNVVLTIFFIYRTVLFLHTDFQMRVIKRYMINVALPREIWNLLRFQVFAKTQENWILGHKYLDDVAEDKPQVLMNSYGGRMGEAMVGKYFREPSRLTNIFYWPLQFAISSWLKKSRKSCYQSNNKKPPLLILPVTPGAIYETNVVLARVDRGAISIWNRLLIRLSFWFSAIRHEDQYVPCGEIFSEVEKDARVAAENSDLPLFEEAYMRMIDIHETLLEACLARTDSGEITSLALIPDIFKFSELRMHESWANMYRSLFNAGISLLPKETRVIEWFCHIVQHLNGPGVSQSPVEIRDRIFYIPTQLMYALGGWWVQKVEEQGVIQHGFNEMALLRPPFQGVYEEILLRFVGGWESARETHASFPDRDEKFVWASSRDIVKLNITHINQTCLMLLKAIARGDRTAAEWFCDVISKWLSNVSFYDHEPFWLHGKTSFITVESVDKDWSDVESTLDIDDNHRQFIDNNRSDFQKYVCLAAVRNYWRDLRILTVEIILDWSLRVEPTDKSLAIYVVTGLLSGRQWRGGGQISESLSQLDASRYLTTKVRQYGSGGDCRRGYLARLNSFVESAQNILSPSMVSGRSYSYVGSDDVASLQAAQLVLFAVLTNIECKLGESLRRQLAFWVSSNFRSTELVKSWAESAKRHIEENKDNFCFDIINKLLLNLNKKHTHADGISFTLSILEKLMNEISNLQSDAIENSKINTKRLSEIEIAASSKGFSKETGVFPMQLFLSIEYLDDPQNPFSINFRNLRKGEFTDIEMAQRPINEGEYYADMLANHVGMLVLSDVIRNSQIKKIVAPHPKAYWKVVNTEADALRKSGLTPVLVLDNPTRPGWVWEWMHPGQDNEYMRPENFVFRREEEGRGDRYVGDFNDIQVFSGPIERGVSFLFPREIFHKVIFRKYTDGIFIKADVMPVKDSKTLIDLRLTYERNVQLGTNKIIRISYEKEVSKQQ